MSVEAAEKSDLLTVEFSVHNRLTEPILVYVYPDDGSRERALVGRSYVSLAPLGDELHLDLLPPPGPENIEWEVGLISLGRRLAGNSSLHEAIQCQLPVREWSPYASDPYPEDSEAVGVTRLRLRTGWFPEAGAYWQEPGPEEGTVWSDGEPLHVLESRLTLATPIPVMRRTDEFIRF